MDGQSIGRYDEKALNVWNLMIRGSKISSQCPFSCRVVVLSCMDFHVLTFRHLACGGAWGRNISRSAYDSSFFLITLTHTFNYLKSPTRHQVLTDL
jgi:hypothetical protein